MPKTILVKSDYKLVQLELDRILYIEGLKDYVKIVLADDPKPILTLMSMKQLEDNLPSNQFIRVHRSFIVQPSKIRVIERNRIVFGKQYIPISDSYKDKFQQYMSTMPWWGIGSIRIRKKRIDRCKYQINKKRFLCFEETVFL